MGGEDFLILAMKGIAHALFVVFSAAIGRDILIACPPRADSSDNRAENFGETKYTPQSLTAV